ncbi:thiamine pyrophosphate-dependent dehydrogenase E1 component subunit alpha [Salinibacterium sp. PAMC 21357]|uniref:thiamine pyrophosphate-dependent dehydrogenase E1 component subunit alpha n=1 Tax=Salinibacterium sp. PAMC 21357 TaxID=1112215 RepID=UPI0002896433|nr:thiamine pyrophosphate-dependent dehydrogenase E1 component subunit alpha [Salinibacterium sp. PAMC 21357]
MSYTAATVQLLSPEGTLVHSDASEQYLPYVDKLSDDALQEFHRHMVVMRRFDIEAANLQRQGQLALWVPSHGQEAAQVGSARAAKPQDHLFPSYREHVIALMRGVDPITILSMFRGLSHGGWDPKEHDNFHLYTLVIGSQTLHGTGYAMGLNLDGLSGTGDPEKDAAVMVYFGDGSTSQGDVSEAMVFAASYQTPQVFFLQNNHWAISVPVSRQSRTPLYLRGEGFGIPSVQIDGNDVLASFAVTQANLDAARSGAGPRFIEALTYRMGAHTTSDDPSKYRDNSELEFWAQRDPITRFDTYLRARGASQAFFDEIAVEGDDLAADIRKRITELPVPATSTLFDHVYSDPHPVMDEQRQALADFEASFEEGN